MQLAARQSRWTALPMRTREKVRASLGRQKNNNVSDLSLAGKQGCACGRYSRTAQRRNNVVPPARCGPSRALSLLIADNPLVSPAPHGALNLYGKRDERKSRMAVSALSAHGDDLT